MNTEMSYLLGMVCGNGTIQRGSKDTTISIEIPHKKLKTEDFHDVKLYVKASIADIRQTVEPAIDAELNFIQKDYSTILSFTKPNTNYLIREILRYTGAALNHDNIILNKEIFDFSSDEKKMFLRGFADVTGYIRRSNCYYNKFEHRVYLEIPNNWNMVIDICNLLKDVDVPIQDVDWAHPNMRDAYCVKYNGGNIFFWKKEHQIKIWANEFLSIGFGVLHKQQALETFSNELLLGYSQQGKKASDKTHRYYWQARRKVIKDKPIHPCENNNYIPLEIRGKHFNSWTEIAKVLGYGE